MTNIINKTSLYTLTTIVYKSKLINIDWLSLNSYIM